MRADSHAIYHWVLKRVREGRLVDNMTGDLFEVSFDDLLSDHFLAWEYKRRVLKFIIGGLVGAIGSREKNQQEILTDDLFALLLDEARRGGNTKADDTDALLEMVESYFDGGVPIEAARYIDFWTNLEVDPKIPLRPLAKQALELTKVHSERSALDRLVGKFKSEFHLLIARYLFEGSCRDFAYANAKEIEREMLAKHIPFKL